MALSDDDWNYIRGLVRMDIRKRERGLAKFAPKPGQLPEVAALIREQMESRLAFRRGLYERIHKL